MRPDAQRLEQPLCNRAEQFVRLQAQGRLGQPRITSVQQGGAQQVQSPDGSVQQGADDWFGGRIAVQLVEVALDHGGGAVFVHRAARQLEGNCVRANSTTAGCAPATLSISTGKLQSAMETSVTLRAVNERLDRI